MVPRVTTASPPDDKPHAGVYRSAALAVALTWSLRLIGLVSALVLARLLTPRDFGIIAMATATTALVDMLGALGLRQALLRIAKPDRAHLDTAWTIQLIVMTTLALVLCAVALPVAAFFRQPELAPVIAVLAISFVFYGIENIGIVDFDRNLDFGRDLRMRLTVRLAGMAGTIAAAVVLRSYWAMALGIVLTAALHCIASYRFHPYRPRLSLERRAELLHVSLWMFCAYAAQVIQHQAERFAVGRFTPVRTVGFYSFSKDLAAIFTLEIATALNRVTFVTTARRGDGLRGDPDRVATMLGAYAIIAAPLGLGLAAVAQDALIVLFGPQWMGAAPYLALLAPATACYAVHNLIVSTLQASGTARGAALLAGAGAATMIAALLVIGLGGGDALALARTALGVNVALLVFGLTVLARLAEAPLIRLLGAALRPFLAAGIMAFAVSRATPDSGIAALDLIAGVALGAAVYPPVLFLLWRLTGRPTGAERDLAILAAGFLGRKTGKTFHPISAGND